MTLSIRQHLESLNNQELHLLLKKLGILQKGLTRKEQLVDAVEQQLRGHLGNILKTLTETERVWLAESVHQCRFIGEAEFKAKFGAGWPWGRPDGSSGFRRETWILEAMVGTDAESGESFVLPELVSALQANLPKPVSASITTLKELPRDWQSFEGSARKPLHVYESERIAAVEVLRMLRLIQAGRIKVTDTARRPTDATTRVVEETLVAPDFALEDPAQLKKQAPKEEQPGPVRAHAWSVLLQQCGWAKAKGSILTLTVSGQEMLHGFNAERYRAGVGKFIANGDFDELHRVNRIRGQTGKHKRWITNPGLRKTAITKVLAAFPPDEWLDYNEARRLVNASGEDWDVTTGDGFLYLCEAQYGSIYNHDGVNSQFLRALLMESLATLGLVDIAYIYPHGEWPELSDNWGAEAGDYSFLGRYDGLRYVRLTPLGAFCFGSAGSYSLAVAENAKLFRVLPNHDLVLTQAHVDPATRAMLEMTSTPRTELLWTLDAERILTHVETGGALTELSQFLQTNAVDGLPDNVQMFLDELENRLSACRKAQRAVLLEWHDEALARMISTSAGLKNLCHHAGGNRLVVAETDYRAFARLVKKLGFVVPPRP